MRRLFPITLIVLLFATFLSPTHAQTPRPVPGPCRDGTLPGGALSRICVPSEGWNGDLLIYAHGYVAPTKEIAIDDALPNGTSLPTIVQSLGYAYATTSYRRNGLVVLDAVDDLRELIAAFPDVAGQTQRRVYVIGASEGALITTLLVERSPELVSGALAVCGPIGDFSAQTAHFSDVRAVFDAVFPGTLPPDAVNIPQEVIANWETVYKPTIRTAISNNPISATTVISVTKLPIDAIQNRTTAQQNTLLDVLWYNVFATNDARQQLGGNPYDNRTRTYSGSTDDALLNTRIVTYTADVTATQSLAQYQTSGVLTRPLIVLHTIGDPIVPVEQATLYAQKVQPSGRGRFTLTTVDRYGHCTFGLIELQTAFTTLVQQVVEGEVRRVFVPLVLR